MPHYFFNVYDDLVALDPEGAHLPGGPEARAHAVQAARCLASAAVLQGRSTASHRIEIVETGEDAIQIVRFDEAVDIRA